MDKIKQWALIGAVILLLTTSLFVYLWIDAKKELNVQRTIVSQNELAFNSKMETIKNENGTLYKRMAFIEDINKKLKNDSTALAVLTRKLGERILSLVTTEAQLKQFRDSVLAVQSFEIPPSLVGKELFFNSDSTKDESFYRYKEKITLGNKSVNDISIWSAPFSLAVATSRDKNGKMSGMIEFLPKWVNKYIKVNDVKVSFDKDEFSEYVNSDNPFSLSVLPSVGFVAMPEIYFSYGAGVFINKKHLIEYQTILGKSFHLVKYSYNIPLW